MKLLGEHRSWGTGWVVDEVGCGKQRGEVGPDLVSMQTGWVDRQAWMGLV